MHPIVLEATKEYLKPEIPDLRVGDTLRVHHKIKEGGKERVQIFEGILIAKRGGKGLNASIKLRRESVGAIWVERIFPLHSLSIVKIEKVKSAKVRRAKLYYLRHLVGKKLKLKVKKVKNDISKKSSGQMGRDFSQTVSAEKGAKNLKPKS